MRVLKAYDKKSKDDLARKRIFDQIQEILLGLKGKKTFNDYSGLLKIVGRLGGGEDYD